MPFYNNCFIYRISFYYIFFDDFSRYKEYVCCNYLNCDVFNTIDFQFQSIIHYYIKFEYKVKDTISYILEKTVYFQRL